MDLDTNALHLGRLLGQLQSLDMQLRSFLYQSADPPHDPAPPGVSLLSVNVGDVLPENAFTDYSTLGQLIKRYNRIVGPVDPQLILDQSVVELRDALVHGRVSGASPEPSVALLKFDKPRNAQARVTYWVLLTETWLAAEVTRVREQCDKVDRAFAVLRPGAPST